MSRDILNALEGSFRRSADFFGQFIETCPAGIWAQTSGRFPVWQIVYHALSGVPFFLASKDAPQPIKPLYPDEVPLFQDLTRAPADKAALSAYAEEVNGFAGKFFASLTDAELSRPHAGASARMQAPLSNAGAITGLIGHHMYHFGMCDAALRAAGLQGLF